MLQAADKNATEPGPTDKDAPKEFTTNKSGLKYRILRKGRGAKPVESSTVKVHYKGTLDNGKVFDSSYERGEPIEFPLTGVIKGWTEGVQLMVTGETRRFWIPEGVAYKGQRDPNGMLVCDVELLAFTAPPTQAPPHVRGRQPHARQAAGGNTH